MLSPIDKGAVSPINKGAVSPIDKGADNKNSISNLRPVSVLTVFSKRFENASKNQLVFTIFMKLLRKL